MLTRAEIVGFAALEQESNAVRPKILPLVVLLCAGSCAPQAPGPGRLLLSNPDFPLINVEAVITANADCDDHLHPSDLGYTKMDDAIDLSLFD